MKFSPKRLNHYVVRSKYNDWFRSFLSNKSNTCQWEGFISQTKIVKCGSLQGSTVGHLLFLVYISFLSKVLENYIFHHFKDNTNICGTKSLCDTRCR